MCLRVLVIAAALITPNVVWAHLSHSPIITLAAVAVAIAPLLPAPIVGKLMTAKKIINNVKVVYASLRTKLSRTLGGSGGGDNGGSGR